MTESIRFQPSRLWALLKKLGWFYTLTLIVSAVALKLFTELADEVLERTAEPLNRQVLLAIHAHHSPTWDRVALTLSEIGSVTGIGLVALVLGLWLLFRGHRLDAAALAASVAGAAVLTVVLKTGFQQARPELFPRLTEELSYSFPSGHSLMSFALYGYIAVWSVTQGPRDVVRWVMAVFCVLLATAIAASRLYLGVHWPTDVVGGALIATFWFSICLVARHWFAVSFGAPSAVTGTAKASDSPQANQV